MIKTQILEKVSLYMCLTGVIIFVVGLISYFNTNNTKQNYQINSPTGLTERDLAISNAIKNGQKTYSYTTNYIPGIGRITNPEQYKAQWQESVLQNNNK
jgi:hypothetical protein